MQLLSFECNCRPQSCTEGEANLRVLVENLKSQFDVANEIIWDFIIVSKFFSDDHQTFKIDH